MNFDAEVEKETNIKMKVYLCTQMDGSALLLVNPVYAGEHFVIFIDIARYSILFAFI